MPFPEHVLARVVETFKNLLHPAFFERTFLEAGATIGRDAVAEAVRLSVRTVENHLARIRENTALHSRGALIRFALKSSMR